MRVIYCCRREDGGVGATKSGGQRRAGVETESSETMLLLLLLLLLLLGMTMIIQTTATVVAATVESSSVYRRSCHPPSVPASLQHEPPLYDHYDDELKHHHHTATRVPARRPIHLYRCIQVYTGAYTPVSQSVHQSVYFRSGQVLEFNVALRNTDDQRVYFTRKIYLYFSIGNGQPREPGCSTVPIVSAHFRYRLYTSELLYVAFYRATLCQRGICCRSWSVRFVRPSVRHKPVLSYRNDWTNRAGSGR